MHEGGWEPFVHHFSSVLEDVVPQDEETRAGGISCTKTAPATGEETRGTWCKGNGRTRAGGISCTKSPPRHARTTPVTPARPRPPAHAACSSGSL